MALWLQHMHEGHVGVQEQLACISQCMIARLHAACLVQKESHIWQSGSHVQ